MQNILGVRKFKRLWVVQWLHNRSRRSRVTLNGHISFPEKYKSCYDEQCYMNKFTD